MRKPKSLPTTSYDGVDLIDKTFAARSAQIDDITKLSPTLGLLRDPNKAGKKAGEEFSEALMAIFGNGTVAECENEIADLIYSLLAAGRSQNKTVKLGNILRILIDRNEQGSRDENL